MSLPDAIAFSPYRVSPLVAHVDHQCGKTTDPALDKGIHIAYAAKHNGVVNIVRQISQTRAVPYEPSVGGYAERLGGHLCGATKVLNDRYALCIGLCGTIEYHLPIGDLLSSAAVIIAFLPAPCRLNSVYLALTEIIFLANKAENKYIGVSCVITG